MNLNPRLTKIFERILHYQRPLKSFATYYFASIASTGLSVLGIYYLTHVLSTEQYGYIGVFNGLVFALPSIMSINALGLVQINIVDLDEIAYVRFRNSFICFCFVIFLAGLLLFTCSAPFMKGFRTLTLLSIVYGFLLLMGQIHGNELIQRGQALAFGVLSLLSIALALGFSVLLISGFGWGWIGRVLSLVIGEFLVLILRLFVFSDIARKFEWKLEATEWKYFTKYGLSLMLALVAGWAMTQSDRFVILNFLNMEAVGIFSVGVNFAGFAGTINSTMVKVVAPKVYRALKAKSGTANVIKLFFFYSIVIIVAVTAIALGALFFLPILVGSRFQAASSVIVLLLTAQVFFGMYQMVGLVIEYLKYNHLRTVILVISTGIGIVCSIGFVKQLGIIGVAIGDIISFALLAALNVVFVFRLIRKEVI